MTTFPLSFKINRKPQMEQRHGQKRGIRQGTQKNSTNTLTGETCQRVGQRTSYHGGTQFVEPSLGVTDHLGVTYRGTRLSRNAGAVRPNVAEHTFHTAVRTEGSWNCWARPKGQLGINAAWATAWASISGTGRLVARMGQRNPLNYWGGANNVA